MDKSTAAIPVWGGIECTINRIHNRYFNQLERLGHYKRENDLEQIAGLGITKLRYPLLWETSAPNAPNVYDFKESIKSFRKIRQLGMTPIAGLLHHGRDSATCVSSTTQR